MSTGWWFAVLPALAVASLVAAARTASWTRLLQDHPNERSLHTQPTPRIGGVVLVAIALSVAALAADVSLGIMLGCALFLAVISLIDDLRSLPVEVRLPAHLVAASVAVLALGTRGELGWIECLVAVLAIAWMANLFNFMDGADGLAGGMAVIGFATFALAAWEASPAVSLVSIAVASASAGFLAHNFPPARVFMGDAGSVPLGFLAGGLGYYGIAAGLWPVWFPLLVFSPFIVDATVTLLRRLLRHERIWKAHREHAYQRLVLSGWTPRRLALSAYALMLAASVSALAGLKQGPRVAYAIILAWLVLYLVLFAVIERRVRSGPPSR